MTVADTIYDTINDNWGNGGYGGTKPSMQPSETKTGEDTVTADVVEVRHFTLRNDPRPVNDTYTDKFYSVVVRITSKTSAAQLKLVKDEVEYLLRNTTMTDLTLVNIRESYVSTSRDFGVHGVDLTVEVASYLASGAITPSTGSAGDMTIGGDLTVTGGDITMGSYDLGEALMLGSANAAWVHCPLQGWTVQAAFAITSNGRIYNVDGTDGSIFFDIPLAATKGSLKLYLSGTKIALADADATDYIDTTYVLGFATEAVSVIDTDTTNKTAVQVHTDTFTAVDCSTYTGLRIRLDAVNTTGGELEVAWVAVQGYYAA
jgi:hypothetical protein